MERLIAWLEKNEPPDDGRVSLVHGDYRLDNMIFAHDASRLLAVIDWELSTLGHPFSDLAYQCMQWRLPNRDAMRGLADVDRKSLGIPTEEEYIAKYCQRMSIPRSRTGNSASPSPSSASRPSCRASRSAGSKATRRTPRRRSNRARWCPCWRRWGRG